MTGPGKHIQRRTALRWARRAVVVVGGFIAVLDFPPLPFKGLYLFRGYENGLYTPPMAGQSATWSMDVATATPGTRLVRTETIVRRQRWALFTLEHREMRIVWDPKSGTPLGGEHEAFIRRVVASHVPDTIESRESMKLPRLLGLDIKSPIQGDAEGAQWSLMRSRREITLLPGDSVWSLLCSAFWFSVITKILNVWRSRRRERRWFEYRCESCGYPDPVRRDAGEIGRDERACPECGHVTDFSR